MNRSSSQVRWWANVAVAGVVAVCSGPVMSAMGATLEHAGSAMHWAGMVMQGDGHTGATPASIVQSAQPRMYKASCEPLFHVEQKTFVEHAEFEPSVKTSEYDASYAKFPVNYPEPGRQRLRALVCSGDDSPTATRPVSTGCHNDAQHECRITGPIPEERACADASVYKLDGHVAVQCAAEAKPGEEAGHAYLFVD